MADPDTLIKAKIHYYCRERQYHAMQFAAVEGMKRFSGDPAFKFFFGMALVLEGQLQEGIRELLLEVTGVQLWESRSTPLCLRYMF